MAYAERKATYAAIETHRRAPMVAFITSARPGAEAIIAGDAVREFVDQFFTLPEGTQNLDVLVNSMGGDGLASWRIASIIRERLGPNGKFRVLVPHYAFSAATILALGADEIYLHPTACLGPVDPQITITTKDGPQRFAYEDLVSFASFLKDEGKLSEQEHLAGLLDNLVKEIRPSVLGASKRSSSQSVTMARRLLAMHMKATEAQKVDAIAEKLNKSYFSHGHAVSRTEAKELGLKVADDDPTLNELIWKGYRDAEEEMQMRKRFDPVALCLAQAGNAFLMAPPPSVNPPANAPPQLLQQFWINQLNAVQTQQCAPQNFELVQGLVESVRARSRFVSKGKAYLWRKPDLTYAVGTPVTEQGWESLTV